MAWGSRVEYREYIDDFFQRLGYQRKWYADVVCVCKNLKIGFQFKIYPKDVIIRKQNRMVLDFRYSSCQQRVGIKINNTFKKNPDRIIKCTEYPSMLKDWILQRAQINDAKIDNHFICLVRDWLLQQKSIYIQRMLEKGEFTKYEGELFDFILGCEWKKRELHSLIIYNIVQQGRKASRLKEMARRKRLIKKEKLKTAKKAAGIATMSCKSNGIYIYI